MTVNRVLLATSNREKALALIASRAGRRLGLCPRCVS